MKVNIILTNGKQFDIDVNEGKTCEEIINEYGKDLPYEIYLCKVNNMYRSLTHKVMHSCTIEFLDMTNQEAWLVYQNSLAFVYQKAIHDTLGNVDMEIANSLNKGAYTIIRTSGIDDEKVKAIENRMKELVDEDLPIVKTYMSKEDAINLAIEYNQKGKIRLLKSLTNLKEVEVYSLDNQTELFYDLMVPSTGYLKYFELRRYKNGVLLRYPHNSKPNIIPEYADQKLLYEAFSEATHWDKLMGIYYVPDLNERVKNNDYFDLIMLQEALIEKKISDIADIIKENKKRIILICGPSSSGKTSFANRLCIQLRVIGVNPLYMGTDDYFVERNETPLDENGEKDYECVEAVDIKLFNDNMNDLLSGKKVDLPTFDFLEGTKKFGLRVTSIDSNRPIVIEGIHALNRKLTSGIDDDEMFKIYISPLTQLNIDNHNRIPTTDARMLRRLVRDYQFRGHSAQSTIDDWPKVRKGEEKNIFPYLGEADIFFNTNYIYELAVLKKYAVPLLKSVKRDEKEYAEAQRMLNFLRYFEEIDDDSMIANNSILREFIGGSVLVK